MIGFIVITHGDFGSYLVEACEHITGVRENIRCVSIHPRMSMSDIKTKIKGVVDEMRQRYESVVYLVDIPGGTPMNVAIPFAFEMEDSYVVCGINMSMVVSAMIWCDKLDAKELVEKIISDGKKSICEVKEFLYKKGSK